MATKKKKVVRFVKDKDGVNMYLPKAEYYDSDGNIEEDKETEKKYDEGKGKYVKRKPRSTPGRRPGRLGSLPSVADSIKKHSPAPLPKKTPVKKKPTTYKMDMACKNCGFDGVVSIIRGKKINQGVCPNCGCKELAKKKKQDPQPLQPPQVPAAPPRRAVKRKKH